MRYLIPVLIIIALQTSCKSHDKAISENNVTATNGVEDSTAIANKQKEILGAPVHRLAVSFISIGEGTFREAPAMLEDYVNQFEKENKVSIIYARKAWGREGESDNYFMLDNLDVQGQRKFIEGVKATFKGNDLIIIEENKPNRFMKQ